ncbi:hypothetical protein [Bacillus wiedmannii]|uniref:DNA delivery protein n=1 Tax=Bacillus wiedmannii TaxID=1890302 RepID=A0A2A8BNT5_9BACI|nr:hypothetical protein [Bacillus wiedmannii]PEM55832.1 hypothetical protein CN611_13245 [Bacillus wiedmannii]HDR7785259.1 hypothetical protein [Bacillus wiedmannii]
MAEIVPVGGGGHGSSPSKKKNKKMLFLAGGVGIVVMLVFLQRSKGGSSSGNVDTLQNTIPISDSQRLDNFQSIVSGETSAQINGMMKDAQDGWSGMFKDFSEKMTNQMKEMDERSKEYNKQQQEWVKDSFVNIKDSLGVGAIRNEDNAIFTVGKGTTGKQPYSEQLNELRNDRQKLNEEIKRTQSVITYRQNNGLDVSAQVQHYKNLGGL